MCNLPVVMNRGRLHARLPPQAQMDGGGIKVADTLKATAAFLLQNHSFHVCPTISVGTLSKPSLTGEGL